MASSNPQPDQSPGPSNEVNLNKSGFGSSLMNRIRSWFGCCPAADVQSIELRSLLNEQSIVLIGPPGSGKGTQAERFGARFGIPHISTGDILRAAMKNDTPLGRDVAEYMNRGELVPDNIIIQVVEERLRAGDCSRGFLLDGFPRTIPQAEALDKTLQTLGITHPRVIELVVPAEELIRRIVERGQSSGRTDDNEITARKRIDIYEKQTAPITGYYDKKGLLIKVQGVGSIDEVSQRISDRLDEARLN